MMEALQIGTCGQKTTHTCQSRPGHQFLVELTGTMQASLFYQCGQMPVMRENSTPNTSDNNWVMLARTSKIVAEAGSNQVSVLCWNAFINFERFHEQW
jgi:hypothetical protein